MMVESMALPTALVLFDIDGTLLRRSGPHHRQALEEAVRRVAGIEATTQEIPVQGMLDRDILRRMLVEAGVAESRIRRLMPELVRKAQAIYVRRCPVDLSTKLCPGARSLLEELRARGAVAGLVSGNLTRIGWKKIERAGLKPFFRFGVFSDRGTTRAALVRLAVGEARRRGWISNGISISHVGDHPNDILAARANRVRAVAVATGLSPREELAAHHPDILVDDLLQLDVERLLS